MKQSNQRLLACTTTGHIAIVVTCAISSSAIAQDVAVASGVGPAGIDAAAIVETQAHVIAIDTASNSVTLRGPRGRILGVVVDPAVGEVSKLRLGDAINIEYQDALLIHADKVKSNGIRERTEETVTIPASLGVTASAHRIRVLASIEKVDIRKRQVTLRGPT